MKLPCNVWIVQIELDNINLYLFKNTYQNNVLYYHAFCSNNSLLVVYIFIIPELICIKKCCLSKEWFVALHFRVNTLF
jgi:hypothetical protein